MSVAALVKKITGTESSPPAEEPKPKVAPEVSIMNEGAVDKYSDLSLSQKKEYAKQLARRARAAMSGGTDFPLLQAIAKT